MHLTDINQKSEDFSLSFRVTVINDIFSSDNNLIKFQVGYNDTVTFTHLLS